MRSSVLISAVAALAAVCQGSRDHLLASLQSVRPEERATAVRRLADHARPEDLVLFLRAAKDPAPVVRGEAAGALGSSSDPRVVETLGELLGDRDESVQGKAAMALAHVSTEEARSYLLVQYGRHGRSTRRAIVEALESANVPKSMAAAVAAESQSIWERNLRALASGTLPEQVAAAEEIGQSGRPEAVSRLLPLINSFYIPAAAAAARGLGQAGDPRAVDPLIELTTENVPELRQAAMQALARLGDMKALPRLKELALEKSAASALATAAIVALPEQAETNAALCEIALGAAPEDACAAGRAMRTRGGCPLGPILEQLRRRGGELAALRALEGLGRNAAIAADRVIPLVGSRDAAIRLQAIRTLAELGEPAAADSIRTAYEQELKRIQKLRAHRASASPAPSRDQVADLPQHQLRTFTGVLRALGCVGAPDALEILEAHARDPSPSVRTAAYLGLVALGSTGIAAASPGLTDPVPEVRLAVAAALAERGADGQAELARAFPKSPDERTALLAVLERAGPTPALADALLATLKEGGIESPRAAQLLGKVGAREAVEPLLTLLDDPGAIGRRELLIALGRLGDPTAAEAIARDLNHESPDVRAAAAEALGVLRKSPRPDALHALEGDYYRRVRQSAEAALARIGEASARVPP